MCNHSQVTYHEGIQGTAGMVSYILLIKQVGLEAMLYMGLASGRCLVLILARTLVILTEALVVFHNLFQNLTNS
jgi:hypothetical protein